MIMFNYNKIQMPDIETKPISKNQDITRQVNLLLRKTRPGHIGCMVQAAPRFTHQGSRNANPRPATMKPKNPNPPDAVDVDYYNTAPVFSTLKRCRLNVRNSGIFADNQGARSVTKNRNQLLPTSRKRRRKNKEGRTLPIDGEGVGHRREN